MQITIRNNTDLPKKYVRFVKWKLYKIQEKFQRLIYVELFLNEEGQSPKTYIVNIRLGIPGNDIILQNKSTDLGEVFKKSLQAVHRYVAKSKPLKIKRRKGTFDVLS